MLIGKLNRKVKILKCIITRDTFGGEEKDWILDHEVWASIETTSGKEYFNREKVTAEATCTITIRYNPNITVLNRIEYNGKLYEIVGVYDDNAEHKATILNCKEIINYGL